MWVLRIADRLNLAPDVAMTSWQARTRAVAKANATGNELQLKGAERRVALEQLRAAAVSEQRLLWGANEKVYFKYSGDWLDGLVK